MKTHGASGYKRGCRCGECREAHRLEARRYYKPVENPKKSGPQPGSVSWNVRRDAEKPLANRRYIPTAPFIPYIEQWVEEHTLAGITARIGTDACSLGKIMKGEKLYISFPVIDRLLCAMGRSDLWHTEFRDLYYSDLRTAEAPPPERRPDAAPLPPTSAVQSSAKAVA